VIAFTVLISFLGAFPGALIVLCGLQAVVDDPANFAGFDHQTSPNTNTLDATDFVVQSERPVATAQNARDFFDCEQGLNPDIAGLWNVTDYSCRHHSLRF
jgi:hypothetical protein